MVVALKPRIKPTPDEESTLLDGCRRGDPDAWRQLYLGYRQEAARALSRVLGPCNELEDLVQIVFLRVHRRLHGFEERSRFSTWLRGICTYVALEHIRKRRRNREMPDEHVADRLVDPAPDPGRRAVTRQSLEKFQASLNKLNKAKRNILVMHDLMEIPSHEIAWMMDIPPATVRTRLFHARKELARRMARSRIGGTP